MPLRHNWPQRSSDHSLNLNRSSDADRGAQRASHEAVPARRVHVGAGRAAPAPAPALPPARALRAALPARAPARRA